MSQRNVVVLEGCLGDWSQRSYFPVLADKAGNGDKREVNEKNKERNIALYCVDVAGMGDEHEAMSTCINNTANIHFINKEMNKGKSKYKKIQAKYVFIVASHDKHCEIAEEWLKSEKLVENGKIFIEKPLDSSVARISEFEKNIKKPNEQKIENVYVVDHYIQKILPLLNELENKGKYGKVRKIRVTLLESNPVKEERKTTLREGLILDMFPHVLAIFTKIMQFIQSQKNTFKLSANDCEILEAKSGLYGGAPIQGETFAKIVLRIKRIKVESYIGKAVGNVDNKTVEIFFEKGILKADFISKNFSIEEISSGKSVNGNFQSRKICHLLNDIIGGKLNSDSDYKKVLTFEEGREIVKIISEIRKNVTEKVYYYKGTSLREILQKFTGIPKEKVVDILLEQYKYLRSEVTQSIYLEHAAILGLYTSLGVIVVALLTGAQGDFSISSILENAELERVILFLVGLLFAQVLINGFGSLFMKEQARNRRACSLLKAIEYLINEKIGEIGIIWENYITSSLIDKKKEEVKDIDFNFIMKCMKDCVKFIRFDIPINRQYYKNRLFSVGIPIFLSNELILCVIGFFWGTFWHRLGFWGQLTIISLTCFGVSLLIIIIWSLMILYKSFSSLKKEKVPDITEVLEWLSSDKEALYNQAILWW
ncbi:MAG: hypothetical protein PVF58_15150 [Candidatus Methanofastidiosia archaeon]|jgi:predicted dehydrogenase